MKLVLALPSFSRCGVSSEPPRSTRRAMNLRWFNLGSRALGRQRKPGMPIEFRRQATAW